MTEQQPQTTTCTLCKESLKPGAVKCIACGGLQGKWNWLNLGVPTLSLLVALVSVISLSISLLAPLLQRQQSDVRVAFQFFQRGAAYFVASNAGSRPGTIGEAWLDHSGAPKPERHYLIEMTGNRFIPPASSRQLSFAIPCGESYPVVQYQKAEGFGAHPISGTRLVVSVVQFNGERVFQKFPVDDLPGLEAINDALHDCLQSEVSDTITPSTSRVSKASSPAPVSSAITAPPPRR